VNTVFYCLYNVSNKQSRGESTFILFTSKLIIVKIQMSIMFDVFIYIHLSIYVPANKTDTHQSEILLFLFRNAV